MADIVLIYPHIGDMDVIRDKPHLPLPLIQAAALADKEYQITIIDLRLISSWRERIEQELKKTPLMVGVSVMSGPPLASAIKISRYIKAVSNVPVVWGGNHPTLDPESVIQDSAVDMVVIGEGEEALLELADALRLQKQIAGIKGVWAKQGDTIIRNPFRPPVDMNRLPLPPYHLVDTEQYIQLYRGRRTINIETSRGCRHQCRYCYHTGINDFHDFRCLDVEKTLDRIFWACHSFSVDGVYLVDDNFFLDKHRGVQIAKRLADETEEIYWQIQGVGVPSMLRFSPAELKTLESSRLVRISVGAESGSPDILRYMKKPHTVEMLTEANKRWRDYDINIFYSWLSGLPGETKADVQQTINLMFRIIKDNPHARLSPLYNFLPFPGTDIWNEVVANHGFKPPERLEQWAEYEWGKVNVSYLEPEMKRLLNNLYWPSLCIDNKFAEYAVPAWLSCGVKVYRPIARWRMKRLRYQWPVEKFLAAAVGKIMSNRRRRRAPWTL